MLVMLDEISGHMDDEQAERYSMGAIPEGELARCEEHLLVCESCQRRVAQSDQYVSSVGEAAARLRAGEKQARPSFDLRRLVPLLAATLLIVLAGTFGLRMINRSTGPIAAVYLQATRGLEVHAQAPEGRPLALNLDMTNLPESARAARIELVDEAGAARWQGEPPEKTGVGIPIPSLKAGVYFVRVYSPEGKLLREFGLEVTPAR
jgi:hypothetical protein